MERVRMLTSVAGEDFVFNVGDVVTVPKGESAASWIKAGIAEPVEDEGEEPKPRSRKRTKK